MIIAHEIFSWNLDNYELYVESPKSKVTLSQDKFMWKMDYWQGNFYLIKLI